LARGEGDLIYVANRSYEYRPDGKRVTVCTVGEDYIGEFARGAVTAGEGEASALDGSIIWPTSVAVDSAGNVYVTDEWLNRVSMFTKDGEWIGKWGTPGDGDGEINRPSGIAFDKDDVLYMVDSLNNRIQKFTGEGEFLGKWGREGSGDGEFNMPWGIDIDSVGDVYVADWRNDRIQKFSADGQFLMKFGTSGSGDGEFNRPTDVAVDKDGTIYVTDWGNERLEVFGPDGSYIAEMTGDATISKWGKEKLDANPEMWQEREIAQGMEREKLFWGAIAVAVDDAGRIFVLESARARIQVYNKQAPVFYGGRL
jgi:DNA-binding beta-propeller fold protein YncE